MTHCRELRELINQRHGLVVPGAYDGVSAKLVEQAGFPVVYTTGYGVPFKEFNELIGVTEQFTQGERYSS
jgi:2-methylisocitrate lyase-like PEP mutase family enzyme